MKKINEQIFIEWEGSVYDAIELQAECTRSDAQGIVEGQGTLMEILWHEGRTPEKAAAAILKASEVNEKELPLDITPGDWHVNETEESVFIKPIPGQIILEMDNLPNKRQNAQAICKAVNGTYKKGYDPLHMDTLYNALEKMLDFYWEGYANPSEVMAEYSSKHPSSATARALQALKNAKL